MSTTVPKPCRWYAQGSCRYGANCRFSHELGSQVNVQSASATERTESTSAASGQLPSRDITRGKPNTQQRPLDNQNQSSSASGTVQAHTVSSPSSAGGASRPKRGEIPCRAWKAGSCARGARCWFKHDPEVQEAARREAEPQVRIAREEAERQAREDAERQARIVREETERARERAREELERARARTREAQEELERVRREQEAARERERQVRAAEIAKEDAAKTIQHVVLGSIVMFSAGLSVDNVITGFESCTVRIKNLPLDARDDEVRTLFTQQGIEPGRFQVVSIRRMQNGKQEAVVIMEAEAGQALSVGLDRLDFRDETLEFEVGAYNSPGSMNAAVGRDTDVLTISWRAPSARYVAEYADIPHANSKVRELDNRIFMGRRVKVEMNSIPPGRVVPSFRPNSIKISNVAHSVSDADVKDFAESDSVRRINPPSHDAAHAVRMLRDHVYRHASDSVRSFDQTSSEHSVDGIITIRVKFTSWEEAQKLHDTLADKKIHYIGNSSFWLKLPTPMFYTIIIPTEQYRAQKMQWIALIESIKDKKACNLIIHELGNIVRIRLLGSVKQAIGALKVRVENLTAGEKIDGWHSLLGYSGSAFVRSVITETGVYIRADWRRQVLKIYGEPKAADNARALVKTELERLSSMEQRVILKRQSVGFFIRRGIPALKETFGEDSIKFDASSRQVTITGGEEARHALARLIDESLNDLPERPPAEQACPICYDEVSSPFQLGCGHVYCMACLRHFLTSAVDSDQFPLACMGSEAQCRIPIAIPTIQRFLPPASFNRLLEVVFDKHIAQNSKEFKYCATPDCTQIYRAAEKDVASALQCPSCFSTVCASCHEDAHEGMTCAEFRIQKDPTEQERLNEEWIARQGGRVKKCPSCSVPIEKLEGCNHMSCRCGAHICWRCMGVFSAETIYTHMHAQHGGIHDEEPAVRVDYQEQQELWRQAQARRALPPPVVIDYAERARQLEMDRARELREGAERQHRLRQEQERNRLQQERWQREYLEQIRERRAQEERARQQRAQRNGGWGCMIM